MDAPEGSATIPPGGEEPLSCLAVRSDVEALVDGTLDGGRAAALRAHLGRCASCRAHHAEACSLPARLAALRSPGPPASLLPGVMARVHRAQVRPALLWSLPGAELALFLVALWYVSGLEGLVELVGRAASDAGAVLGWGAGLADLPAPPAGDLFLLLVAGLLLVVTLYHLSLLARHGSPAP